MSLLNFLEQCEPLELTFHVPDDLPPLDDIELSASHIPYLCLDQPVQTILKVEN